MRRIAILMMAAAVSIGVPSQALAITLDFGSISYPGGISATDGWQSTSTSLSWTITNPGGAFPWHYEYSWTAATKGLTQFILEVSAGALASDFSNFSTSWSSGMTTLNPTTYTPPLPGSPGLPGTIYGIKFSPTPDGSGDTSTSFSWSFDSTHKPEWGDFYAKDGKQQTTDGKIDVIAYNIGFSAGGAGSGDDGGTYIAVPGTLVVPEPSTLLLMGVGLVSVGLAVRKKRFLHGL